MDVVIIGGGTAGSELAFQLRKLDKDVKITIIDKEKNELYSPCSLPYVISGEINVKDIIIYYKEDYKANNISVVKGNVDSIDRKKKLVNCDGKLLKYDKLVIATGSRAIVPGIFSDVKCFTLKNLEDAKAIMKAVKKGKKCVVVGGGYIGVEVAYALKKKGAKVTIIEAKDRLLCNGFDKEMSSIIKDYVEKQGIKVVANACIKEVGKGRISLEKAAGENVPYDLLILSCGVMANIELAANVGLKCRQGIAVDDYLMTNDNSIYAIGDCASAKSLIFGREMMSQLGTTAVEHAKACARNILGKKEKFSGVLNTTVSKAGELVFGATGITEEIAAKNGINTVGAVFKGSSKAEYHPDGKEIIVKITADDKQKIIGCQIIGNEDIPGRLNMAALAIKQGMKLKEFVDTETCYNPCVASMFDPLTTAAEICLKKWQVRFSNQKYKLFN